MKTLKNTTIILLALLIVGFTSCKKDKQATTADITVLEKGTNVPAVGIPVNFGYSTSGVFSSQVVEQSQTTDVNGKVSFKAQDKSKSYSVGFPNGANYFGDGASLVEGKNNRVFLYTSPFAYVRIHAKNTSPFDSNDWMGLSGGLLGGGVVFMELP